MKRMKTFEQFVIKVKMPEGAYEKLSDEESDDLCDEVWQLEDDAIEFVQKKIDKSGLFPKGTVADR